MTTVMTNRTEQDFDTDWQNRYRSMIGTPDDAVARIKPGQRVFIGTGCAQPIELVKALTARAPDLPDIEITQLLTMGHAPYAARELARNFRVNSFFVSDNVRDVIEEGLGDYTPIFLSDVPRLIASGRLPIDVVLIQVSPPDKAGMCSLGISVDIVKSATENAGLVIAQVNPQMPRTMGNTMINVYDMDVLVPVDAPLIEVQPPEPTEESRRIGENVASLIDDGATLELGIGVIHQSVLGFLKGKHDIGIHSEMVTDAVIDVIESGVVTGLRKKIDRGRVVASFCVGTRRLYEYVHNNQAFSFQPTEYVNDAHVISRLDKMVSINAALEVDLTGQVCGDSIGSRFYAGIGGETDFNRGAAASRGGKPIIALPSTTPDGKASRILCRLSTGAGVVTTRGDVHYVVTEHGVAYLHGKSIEERAVALISIAHPDFREKLLEQAIEAKLVRPEMADVGGKIYIGPKDLETSLLLDDGTQVSFRPIHPTDEHRMKDLFYALSQSTIYYRFMSHLRRFPIKELQKYVYVNHRSDVAIVGTLPAASGEQIIAIGRYYLDKKTNRAEVAFVVHDKYQGHGIGNFLFKHMVSAARRNGIAGFTAEVLNDNKPMLTILNNSGFKVHSSLAGNVYSMQLDFE